MTDVDFLSPQAEECIWATHIEILARAAALTGVVNGNAVTPTSPESMDLDVGAGRIRIAGAPLDVDADTATVGASNVILSRIDVIIRDAAGAVQVVPGALDVIEDSKGLGNWHQYTTPAPPDTIAEGVILAAVFVAASVTAIGEDDIWMMAGPVGDIKTTAASPGVDNLPLSEKASVAAFVRVSEKGAASGVATLDEGSHVVQEPASKAQASGLASLTALSKVVQDPDNATATPTANKIPISDASHFLDPGWLPIIQARNNAWNSSFEHFLGAAACLGWTKLGTATIAQNTGIRDGYGGSNAIKITSAGTNNEGVSQTLKNLKASTLYTVRVWMKATSGDTAKAWTTGATTNLSITSTSTTGEWVTGTFTTDATPTDVVFKLGSATSTDIVWFDCLTITEGSQVPLYYWKDKEWDTVKQLSFGNGNGIDVVATGAIPGVLIAEDNYQIVGWKARSNVSATVTFDVWKKAGSEPTNSDSLGATKPSITSGVSNSSVPNWSVVEITKGDQLRVEIEANNNGTEIDFFLLIRRR